MQKWVWHLLYGIISKYYHIKIHPAPPPPPPPPGHTHSLSKHVPLSFFQIQYSPLYDSLHGHQWLHWQPALWNSLEFCLFSLQTRQQNDTTGVNQSFLSNSFDGKSTDNQLQSPPPPPCPAPPSPSTERLHSATCCDPVGIAAVLGTCQPVSFHTYNIMALLTVLCNNHPNKILPKQVLSFIGSFRNFHLCLWTPELTLQGNISWLMYLF